MTHPTMPSPGSKRLPPVAGLLGQPRPARAAGIRRGPPASQIRTTSRLMRDADQLGEALQDVGEAQACRRAGGRPRRGSAARPPLGHAFGQARVLHRDRHLVGDDLQELLLVGLGAGRQHVAGDHHAEGTAAHRERQRPLDLGPVVRRRGRRPGQHAARLARSSSHRSRDHPGVGRQLDATGCACRARLARPAAASRASAATPTSEVMSCIARWRSASWVARRTKCWLSRLSSST